MLDFFYYLYSDFGKSPFETAMPILLSFCILFALGLIIWGIYMAIDRLFLPVHEGIGIVTEKDFIEAHTDIELVYNAVIKTSMPQTVYHPDYYNLKIKIGECFGNLSVEKAFYNVVNVGENVFVEYSTGRINKYDVYIKAISK